MLSGVGTHSGKPFLFIVGSNNTKVEEVLKKYCWVYNCFGALHAWAVYVCAHVYVFICARLFICEYVYMWKSEVDAGCLT